MTLLFHGEPLPSFVKITRIESSLLPPVESSDAMPSNKSRGREFHLEYFLLSISREDLAEKMHQFGKWLYTEKAEPLILPHASDKVYRAKVEGNTDVHTTHTTGRGTVTFVCEPYALSKKERNIVFDCKERVEVNNRGDFDAFPVINLVFQKNMPSFMISNDAHWMSFGSTAPVDKVGKVPTRKQVLRDDGTSRVGWTGGVGVDNGIIAGELESTGRYLQTMGKEYGEGNAWHGPAGIKMWDHGITDFTLEATIGFKSIYMYQIGRIEIYLLDKDQVRIGKVGLRDAHVGIHNPALEARVGPVSGGVYFVKKEIDKRRGNDFYGNILLTRMGTRWKVELIKLQGKGAGKRWTGQMAETGEPVEIHGLQIHLGSFGKYQPYSTAYIQNIRMWEESPREEDRMQIPGFEEGDHLVIDSNTGTVRKNGVPYYDNVDPRSSFVRFPQGRTGLSFSPGEITGSISFRERYR